MLGKMELPVLSSTAISPARVEPAKNVRTPAHMRASRRWGAPGSRNSRPFGWLRRRRPDGDEIGNASPNHKPHSAPPTEREGSQSIAYTQQRRPGSRGANGTELAPDATRDMKALEAANDCLKLVFARISQKCYEKQPWLAWRPSGRGTNWGRPRFCGPVRPCQHRKARLWSMP